MEINDYSGRPSTNTRTKLTIYTGGSKSKAAKNHMCVVVPCYHYILNLFARSEWVNELFANLKLADVSCVFFFLCDIHVVLDE